MKYSFLVFFSLIGFLSVQGQGLRVTGKVVKDGSSDPIADATVTFLSLPDSVQALGITTEEGKFSISLEKTGAHLFLIVADGFETLERRIVIPATGLDIPNPIGLTAAYSLDAVTISAEAAIAQQKGDTTEFNASAFTTNPDASASDLIQKMPGITGSDGQVTAQGERVTQVLVDGKPFFGDDPRAALNNLPAEVVQKIQVFDQQSEQSRFTGVDDGETVRTINIVTKPETRNGTFGTGYAGYGTEDRYRAGGNVNFFKDARRISVVGITNNINQQNFASDDLLGVASAGAGRGRGGRGGRGGGDNVGDFLVGEQGGISTTHSIGINYSDQIGKKLQLTGSYFFNQSDNVADQEILQQFLTGRDTGQVYQERLESDSRNLNHRANFRLELEFTERTSLIWVPRVSIQQNQGNSLTLGTSSLGDALLNSSVIDFDSDLTAINANNFLLLRHRFEKPGRTLSLRVSTGYNRSNGLNSQYSALNYFSSAIPSDTLDQRSFLEADGWSGSANLTWTEQIFEKVSLSTWYEYEPRWNDSERETFNGDQLSGEYARLDTQLTNVFSSTYRTQQLGTGISWRTEKGFLNARLGVQEAKLNNEQVFPRVDTIGFTFYNLLPRIMFRQGRGTDNSFFAMYRSGTNAPSVSQLQDVVNNANPLQLSSGNSELKQSFDHRMFLRYNKTNTASGRLISLNLSSQLSQNYIARSSYIAVSDTVLANGLLLPRGGQFTQPVNLNGYLNLRSFFSIGQSIAALKSNVNFNVSGNFVRTPGLVNGRENVSGNTGIGLGLVLSSNINKNIDFTISSNSDFNMATNSLQEQLNTQFWSQTSRARINLISPGGWVIRTSLDHTLYRGLTDGFNQDFFLWSGGVAKKFFKEQRGELELSVFDVLGQNTAISRTVTEIYIQDLQQTVLQRYAMLTFRYQLRNFVQSAPEEGDWRR